MSEHPSYLTPAERARRGIAAKLARPFSDVDKVAAEIIDALTADGWKPPRPAPKTPSWQPADPVDETRRRAHIDAIRAQLAHRRTAPTEPEDSE